MLSSFNFIIGVFIATTLSTDNFQSQMSVTPIWWSVNGQFDILQRLLLRF